MTPTYSTPTTLLLGRATSATKIVAASARPSRCRVRELGAGRPSTLITSRLCLKGIHADVGTGGASRPRRPRGAGRAREPTRNGRTGTCTRPRSACCPGAPAHRCGRRQDTAWRVSRHESAHPCRADEQQPCRTGAGQVHRLGRDTAAGMRNYPHSLRDATHLTPARICRGRTSRSGSESDRDSAPAASPPASGCHRRGPAPGPPGCARGPRG